MRLQTLQLPQGASFDLHKKALATYFAFAMNSAMNNMTQPGASAGQTKAMNATT